MRRVFFALSIIRLVPHLIVFNLSSKKADIQYEISRWLTFHSMDVNIQKGFLRLMTFVPEYRNLFYYRIGAKSWPLQLLCPKMNTLFIETLSIGYGLFIQHGFATIIAAKALGKNCWVNQQVTIGYNGVDNPIINDNVEIKAGAKIIGNVIIGSNSIVGANAVVVKNVPDNCVVVGVPAYIVKKDGVKIKQPLT